MSLLRPGVIKPHKTKPLGDSLCHYHTLCKVSDICVCTYVLSFYYLTEKMTSEHWSLILSSFCKPFITLVSDYEFGLALSELNFNMYELFHLNLFDCCTLGPKFLMGALKGVHAVD